MDICDISSLSFSYSCQDFSENIMSSDGLNIEKSTMIQNAPSQTDQTKLQTVVLPQSKINVKEPQRQQKYQPDNELFTDINSKHNTLIDKDSSGNVNQKNDNKNVTVLSNGQLQQYNKCKTIPRDAERWAWPEDRRKRTVPIVKSNRYFQHNKNNTLRENVVDQDKNVVSVPLCIAYVAFPGYLKFDCRLRQLRIRDVLKGLSRKVGKISETGSKSESSNQDSEIQAESVSEHSFISVPRVSSKGISSFCNIQRSDVSSESGSSGKNTFAQKSKILRKSKFSDDQSGRNVTKRSKITKKKKNNGKNKLRVPGKNVTSGNSKITGDKVTVAEGCDTKIKIDNGSSLGYRDTSSCQDVKILKDSSSLQQSTQKHGTQSYKILTGKTYFTNVNTGEIENEKRSGKSSQRIKREHTNSKDVISSNRVNEMEPADNTAYTSNSTSNNKVGSNVDKSCTKVVKSKNVGRRNNGKSINSNKEIEFIRKKVGPGWVDDSGAPAWKKNPVFQDAMYYDLVERHQQEDAFAELANVTSPIRSVKTKSAVRVVNCGKNRVAGLQEVGGSELRGQVLLLNGVEESSKTVQDGKLLEMFRPSYKSNANKMLADSTTGNAQNDSDCQLNREYLTFEKSANGERNKIARVGNTSKVQKNEVVKRKTNSKTSQFSKTPRLASQRNMDSSPNISSAKVYNESLHSRNSSSPNKEKSLSHLLWEAKQEEFFKTGKW